MEFLENLFKRKKVPESKYNDDDLVKLGEEIEWFWKSRMWKEIIKPFTQDWTIKNMSRGIQDVSNLSHDDMKTLFHSARFGLSLQDEIHKNQDVCNLAKQRVLKRLKRKGV